MAQYTISDLQTLTGVKAHTLRVWERRYDIIKPSRTKTNIRYYEDEDLRMLLCICYLNQRGYRISDIASMSFEQIEEKILELMQKDSNEASLRFDGLTYAMLNLDEIKFETIFSGYCRDIGFERTLTNVFFPFLDNLSQLWDQGLIHAGHENFIIQNIRKKLYCAINSLPIVQEDAPKFLIFLPDHEDAEIACLFLEYMAKSENINCLNIGNLRSIADIERIRTKFDPDLVFSILNPGANASPPKQYIKDLLRIMPRATLLLTGFSAYNTQIPEEPRLIRCRGLGEVIEKIRSKE